ncbi:hypothetical protein LTR95_000994 [Oleoguttula sp. CCFEE 5521]
MPLPENLLKSLLALKAPTAISLSADGKRVLYSTNLSWAPKKGTDARSTLWLADTYAPTSARQISSGLFYDTVPVWSPDSEHVAFVSDRAKSGERSALYVMNVVQCGEGVAVTDTKFEKPISKVSFSPDGKKIAFLSADEKTPEKKKRDAEKHDAMVFGEEVPYPKLRVTDLQTKDVQNLSNEKGHVLDFDWDDSGKSIVEVVTARPDFESHTGVVAVELEGGTRSTLGKIKGFASSPIWVRDDFYFVGPVAEVKACSGYCVYTASSKQANDRFTNVEHGESDCARDIVKAGKDAFVRVHHGLVDKIYHVTGEPVFEVQKKLLSWHVVQNKDSTTILALAYGDIHSPPEVHAIASSASSKEPVTPSTHGSTS